MPGPELGDELRMLAEQRLCRQRGLGSGDLVHVVSLVDRDGAILPLLDVTTDKGAVPLTPLVAHSKLFLTPSRRCSSPGRVLIRRSST